MAKNYPQGYWSMVFEQAASLLNSQAVGSSEAAYWMARRLVDETINGAILFENSGTSESRETLVLAST